MMMWRKLRMMLITLALLTGALFLTAAVLRHLAPALSVPQLLYQARYGLLVWRLCLYAAITALWWRLYLSETPASRRQMKRTMVCFLVLVALSEFSTLQQTGGEG